MNRRLEKEPLDYSVLKGGWGGVGWGEDIVARAAEPKNPGFFLWCALPLVDYLMFILIKVIPVAGLFIALLSCVGSLISNSMGNFTWQFCSSEGTAVQVFLRIFLRLVRIGYIWDPSAALNLAEISHQSAIVPGRAGK